MHTHEGIHNISIQCWKPREFNYLEEMRSSFVGSCATSNAQNESLVFNEAWKKRHQISSSYSGQVNKIRRLSSCHRILFNNDGNDEFYY